MTVVSFRKALDHPTSAFAAVAAVLRWWRGGGGRHGLVPSELLQVPDREGRGQGGGVVRPQIQVENGPPPRARAIAVQCGKAYTPICTPAGVEPALQALEALGEACSHRLGRGFLTGPQRKETFALSAAAAKTGKHLYFRRREIAARDVQGARHLAPPLDIDPHWLPASHCQDAAISAVRKAELETGSGGRPDQSWLAVSAAREDKVRGVGSGIFGKDPPCDFVRLHEVHAEWRIREARCTRRFFSIKKREEPRRALFVLDQGREPNMDFAMT